MMNFELKFIWKIIKFIVFFVIMLGSGIVAYFTTIPKNTRMIIDHIFREENRNANRRK